MPDSRNLTLTEVLKLACDRWAAAHWLGAMPARVERFDPATGEIDAKPIIRDPVEAEGVTTLEDLPVIAGVPLMQFGMGGMRITFPAAVGDTVLLVFCRRSLDKWKARGGADVDSGDNRLYHYHDAVAIPGILPFSAPWTGVRTDAITLGPDGGDQIHITDAAILLGGTGATQAAVNGDAYRSAEDTLFTALGAFATAVGVALVPVAGAAATLNTAIGVFQSGGPSYKSTLVKVKP